MFAARFCYLLLLYAAAQTAGNNFCTQNGFNYTLKTFEQNQSRIIESFQSALFGMSSNTNYNLSILKLNNGSNVINPIAFNATLDQSAQYSFDTNQSFRLSSCASINVESNWYQQSSLLLNLISSEVEIQTFNASSSLKFFVTETNSATTTACLVMSNGYATVMPRIWINGKSTISWIYKCSYFFPALSRSYLERLDQSLNLTANAGLAIADTNNVPLINYARAVSASCFVYIDTMCSTNVRSFNCSDTVTTTHLFNQAIKTWSNLTVQANINGTLQNVFSNGTLRQDSTFNASHTSICSSGSQTQWIENYVANANVPGILFAKLAVEITPNRRWLYISQMEYNSLVIGCIVDSDGGWIDKSNIGIYNPAKYDCAYFFAANKAFSIPKDGYIKLFDTDNQLASLTPNELLNCSQSSGSYDSIYNEATFAFTARRLLYQAYQMTGLTYTSDVMVNTTRISLLPQYLEFNVVQATHISYCNNQSETGWIESFSMTYPKGPVAFPSNEIKYPSGEITIELTQSSWSFSVYAASVGTVTFCKVTNMGFVTQTPQISNGKYTTGWINNCTAFFPIENRLSSQRLDQSLLRLPQDQNILINGNFRQLSPAFFQGYITGPALSLIPPWQTEDPSMNVELWDNYNLDLNSDRAYTIYQICNVTIGKTYLLTFDLSINPYSVVASVKKGHLYAEDAIFSFTGVFEWHTIQLIFIAKSSNVSIKLGSDALSASGPLGGKIRLTENKIKYQSLINYAQPSAADCFKDIANMCSRANSALPIFCYAREISDMLLEKASNVVAFGVLQNIYMQQNGVQLQLRINGYMNPAADINVEHIPVCSNSSQVYWTERFTAQINNSFTEYTKSIVEIRPEAASIFVIQVNEGILAKGCVIANGIAQTYLSNFNVSVDSFFITPSVYDCSFFLPKVYATAAVFVPSVVASCFSNQTLPCDSAPNSESTISLTCSNASLSNQLFSDALSSVPLSSLINNQLQSGSASASYQPVCQVGLQTSWNETFVYTSSDIRAPDTTYNTIIIQKTPTYSNAAFIQVYINSFGVSSVQFACLYVDGQAVNYDSIPGSIIGGYFVTHQNYDCNHFVDTPGNSSIVLNDTSMHSDKPNDLNAGIGKPLELFLTAVYIAIAYIAAYRCWKLGREQKLRSRFKTTLNAVFLSLFLVWGTGTLLYAVLINATATTDNFLDIQLILTFTYFITYSLFVLVIHWRFRVIFNRIRPYSIVWDIALLCLSCTINLGYLIFSFLNESCLARKSISAVCSTFIASNSLQATISSTQLVLSLYGSILDVLLGTLLLNAVLSVRAVVTATKGLHKSYRKHSVIAYQIWVSLLMSAILLVVLQNFVITIAYTTFISSIINICVEILNTLQFWIAFEFMRAVELLIAVGTGGVVLSPANDSLRSSQILSTNEEPSYAKFTSLDRSED